MIILIRHATPLIDYTRCDYKTACARLVDYNETKNIDEKEIDNFKASLLYQKIKRSDPLIYCSPLARAERTCQILFHDQNNSFRTDEQLREVELDILPIPLVKMSVRSWFFISRLAWLFGISNVENKTHAIGRAQYAYNLLKSDNNIAVISHGYLIYYIKNQLRKSKYKKIETYHEGCFSVEVYDK